MSDSVITLRLTVDEMTLLIMNYRQGIKHLLGEREFIKLCEEDDPSCATMLEIIDEKYHASMVQYDQLERLRKTAVAASVAEQAPEASVSEPALQMPELGAKVQYIGNAKHLVLGRLYTVIEIVDDTIAINTGPDFVSRKADIIPINHDYYPSSDFTTKPDKRVGYEVQYIGHDHGVGDERVFKIERLQSWGGTPYIGITTKTAFLSYPAVEFRLLEHDE